MQFSIRTMPEHDVYWCVARFEDSGRKIVIVPTTMIRQMDRSDFRPECAQDLPSDFVEVQWQKVKPDGDTSFDGFIKASILAIGSKFFQMK